LILAAFAPPLYSKLPSNSAPLAYFALMILGLIMLWWLASRLTAQGAIA
jgi:hypothetical protein